MIKNRNLKLAVYTLLPGVLLYLAWPPKDLFFLSFIAFVPLFLLEKETENTKGFGKLAYTSLLFWNILTTWWVWYASPAGSIAMLLANSGLMLLPWIGYRKVKQSIGTEKALLAFITFWLMFEYIHLNWQITWPWLTLGNVFAKHNNAVQWYEVTGVLGGSLWVLLLNVLIFKAILAKSKKAWVKPSLLFIIPLCFSVLFRFLSTQVSFAFFPTYETLLVQPNIDPYAKFNKGQEINTLQKMLYLAEDSITEETKYVVMPETAVVEYIDEDNAISFESIRRLKAFTKRHPQIHLITGVSTYNFYNPFEKRSETVRKTADGDEYESYNTAMEMDSTGNISWYHKSKLVPGVEKMPYPKLFGFLEYFSIDMGGISGSLGSDSMAKAFEAGEKPDVAALICYESVFPGYVIDFVNQGAEILFIITNDGWWKDTDGYKQHLYYATLRAIETRREVLRSANTGISCHINRLGDIVQKSNWDEAIVLKARARNHAQKTIYTRHGDYIGRIAVFIGLIFILGIFVKRRIK
ncbi:MAG: apolipoprotein N-acyltransferase [Bacteroidota bacterium]|jgi:apolipoprotein N-acyltransferase